MLQQFFGMLARPRTSVPRFLIDRERRGEAALLPSCQAMAIKVACRDHVGIWDRFVVTFLPSVLIKSKVKKK